MREGIPLSKQRARPKGGVSLGPRNGGNDFSTASNNARHHAKSDCLHAYLEFHDMFVVLFSDCSQRLLSQIFIH